MDFVLTEPEIRVLGSLVEKEIATPEYYPMSLNALTNACNQKTNREPVVDYHEDEVREALYELKDKGLAIVCEGSRVFKYDNYLADQLGLSGAEVAAICVLMLRGPQTPGEIRNRSDRLYSFAELSEVETTLDGLAAREDGPFVVKLPRQPGRKENRYAHLLGGPVSVEPDTDQPAESGETLRTRVDRLESDLAALRQEFAEFRKQFE